MFARLIRNSSLSAPRRFFCQHNQQGLGEEELRDKILKTALIHVNRIGWNDQALAEACIDLGYPSVTSRVVPNGAIDLVYYAMDTWNDRLTEDLSYLELEEMRISDRIIEGIKIRLSYEIPYVSRWQEAMALGGLPMNAPYTLKRLTRVADDIWYIAGDRSTDLNWYTKRGLLLSAYTTTELFMLTDRSQNYAETWNFLERRIRDILKYGKYINTAKNLNSAAATGVGSLLSMFARIPTRVENDIEDLKYHASQSQASETHENISTESQEHGEDQPKTKKQRASKAKTDAEHEGEEDTGKKTTKGKKGKKDHAGEGVSAE